MMRMLGRCSIAMATVLVMAACAHKDHVVVYHGKQWSCTKVNNWRHTYGSYAPDGTPIPYSVEFLCLQGKR